MDVFQIEKIVKPIVNQTIDKIYSETNHSYIIDTKHNISFKIVNQLPILLYRQPHYIIITHAPIQFTNIANEWIYKKNDIIWYNYKEQKVKLWSMINHVWYESCDYPYRFKKI
jgi:hypothetical protein